MLTNENKLHEIIQNIWMHKECEDRDMILKEKYEQYYTSSSIANYMASFFNNTKKKDIRMLDPGAGFGSLTIAVVLATFKWKVKPKTIHAILYEIDITVKYQLEFVMEELVKVSHEKNINFSWEVRYCDFIEDGVIRIKNKNTELFDYVILNPPYRKLAADSIENRWLLDIGIDSSNFYAAFVSLAKRSLIYNGELVAITPRSFCNGVYFNKYRSDIKADLSFVNIHLFDSRTSQFRKDDVLQETIIYHCIKEEWDDNKNVKIIYSTDDAFSDLISQDMKLSKLIYPADQNNTIRIVKNDEDKLVSNKIESLPCSLNDLNIQVSTGPVVDFRENKELLSKEVVKGSVPFLCSNHIKEGMIKWPLPWAKHNSLIPDEKSMKKLRPTGNYVLVKRISSKEEKRRVVCAIVQGEKYDTNFIAFDNKTNYFHRNKSGMDLDLAAGIYIYLSSSIVDMYFRIFSGHTQVNATDLRGIKFPDEKTLKELGEYDFSELQTQQDIDNLVEKVIFD
ncbi:Eco57I restriction-modification methylase domain-containing protein [Clostridium estertheticum]|uniref:Eco57I restriction-modification methylase domain-containing protein n=1 Tax=Clostridium estertheticum TaxID=238834 RepID=UPI001CF2F63B|nr:Eco57I restriction-modification methylase domain-containing protein [Clostridium estertheticum]MCB2305614.1 Eco57I restriction-modification methylase domain-containing protein [Clostridium estertheticum]MCB2344570.1 Eco57I restriction-modification methylase domain-containing protein [Clostridium estertheticum]MCB2347970.1 Eco57I restriction-modification methylase domain-containing protein [Clostridium estertheticum]WAG45614.1 Eco57I restriction-modification methylase domain-containing protei